MPRNLIRSVVFVWLLAGCGAAPVYEPAATQVLVATSAIDDDYFSAPWPDDRRLEEDGTLDIQEFPNPKPGGLYDLVLETSNGMFKGWGLSSPVYIPFGSAIDPKSLPENPLDATDANASVYLTAINPSSPVYARRVPLDWKWMPDESSFLPDNVLAARPAVGLPLEEETLYALVVTTSVKDADGRSVGPQQDLWRVFNPWKDEKQPQDAAHWQPLVAFLDDQGIARETVAGAALFTTQNATGELLRVRDAAIEAPAPQLESPKYVTRRSGSGPLKAEFVLFEGTYKAPNYQHGKPPYERKGGEFRFDENGKPLVGATESMRVSICVPTASPMPTEGFPVVLSSHGTGGDFETSVYDNTCALMATKGIAVFSIDQVLHGPRSPEGARCHGMDVENCFFNIVNGRAGRTTIQQSAIDNISLRRLVQNVTIDPDLDHNPFDNEVKFDTRHLGFFGHSQGGLTGALYAAIEPELAGAALSAGGGHLTTSILERDDGMLKDLAESPIFLSLSDMGETLDQFHPALGLMQMLGEAADPLTWAPGWIKRPVQQRKHIFIIGGWLDAATPVSSTEALAANGGVPQLEDEHRESSAHELSGLSPVKAPLTANIPADGDRPAVTAGLQQFENGDHFPVFRYDSARFQLAAFLADVVAGHVPTIPARDLSRDNEQELCREACDPESFCQC